MYMKKKELSHVEETHDFGNIKMGKVRVDMQRFSAKPDTSNLLLLPTRNLVMFPGITMPLGLSRDSAKRIAKYAEESGMPIGIVCQIDPGVENPQLNQLYKFGVVGIVLKVFEFGEEWTALIRSQGRFETEGPADGALIDGFHAQGARVRLLREYTPRRQDTEFDLAVETIVGLAGNIAEKSGEPAMTFSEMQEDGSPALIINHLASTMPIEVPDKIQMLATNSLKERAMLLLGLLQRSDEKADLRRALMERTRQSMEQGQRNAFLQQQMESIREELYGNSDLDEIDELEQRIKKAGLPESANQLVTKELTKLRRLNPSTPDYSVLFSYIELVISLPWNKESEPNRDFTVAEERLNADHYGLDKVKERIIEQLAVVMNNPDGKAPILCLVGPPGVGKTSLGKSIAAALGRDYQRVSLGGLHDEAEIRGHRRTYIGAMPGRIIDAMRRAGTRNPIILLDELDKIGADYKGDPAAAMLEVLDPEQNCRFHDNYVDVDFDLSKVLFIATANTLQTVSRPLLDRIEVIELPGYAAEEKIEIAKRHILPRLIKEMDAPQVEINDKAMRVIIDNYTSESGVRQLEKALAKIVRKAILAKMRGTEFAQPVMPEHLKDLLGMAPYRRDQYEGNDLPGVVTGLAWTQVGGETLLVEASTSPAKSEGKLTLTGHLGDVMKESAAVALQWVKANGEKHGIEHELFDKHNLHINFPEGAVPKDGPSAGITIATAIVSAITGRKVRERIAMTGEITLRGKVLPVGGIREKILAAKRAGITDIVMSSDNRRDIEDIRPDYLEGLTFHYVDTVDQVIDYAILS